MNHAETGLLLGKIASIDNRTIDQITIAAWQELLESVSLSNAMDALREHRTTKPGVWVEPGHILAGAKAARRQNLDRMRSPEPPESLDGIPEREHGWRRTYIELIGDGLTESEADAQACAEHGVTRAQLDAAPRPVQAAIEGHRASCRCGCLTRPVRAEEGRP